MRGNLTITFPNSHYISGDNVSSRTPNQYFQLVTVQPSKADYLSKGTRQLAYYLQSYDCKVEPFQNSRTGPAQTSRRVSEDAAATRGDPARFVMERFLICGNSNCKCATGERHARSIPPHRQHGARRSSGASTPVDRELLSNLRSVRRKSPTSIGNSCAGKKQRRR